MNGYIEAGYLIVGASLAAYGGHLAVQRRRLERRCRQAFGDGRAEREPSGGAPSTSGPDHGALEGRRQ